MENPARYYMIHKCCRTYLKIPLKGNHILKFNTLIIDISCSSKSEISRGVHLQKKKYNVLKSGSFQGLKHMQQWIIVQLPIIYFTLI